MLIFLFEEGSLYEKKMPTKYLLWIVDIEIVISGFDLSNCARGR